ncbi:MAG: carbon-nitrogen hydrolase family protein [Actinobacteria bacterium]|nr:carbon-nitrogen hydrolase family protein [Actinomycetota bacterium]
MTVLTVATCQFPVSADIGRNLRWMTAQLAEAARGGARVAHFPEGALSGYAGADFRSFAGYDWHALDRATDGLRERARELGIWVAAGSAHRFSGTSAPHNSLYVISDGGEVAARYDKRFLGRTDLDHYSPGRHFSTWVIDGVRCGALICYDYRFPELYRHYVTLDVRLMLHSFHAGNTSPARVAAIGAAIGPEYAPLNPAATLTYPGVTMPAVMTASAACNNMWISCPNSSAPESLWPAFFVRSDGITTGRLARNVPGVLLSTVDTDQDLYDSTGPWRRRAIAGTLHSGELADDDR